MQRGAVLYLRVSSQQQVGNFSIPVQEEACKRYCQANGLRVVRVFREQGESAKTAERTQLNELLTYLSENKQNVSAVVVHSVSRWSRDVPDFFKLKSLLRGWGISLRSATEAIDDTASGELMEGVHAVLARFENRQRTDRTVAGMRKALEGGRWVHRAPLGYLNGGRGNRGEPSLKPNPATADMVRAAFEGYAAGLSEREVQHRLKERGFRMPDGRPMSLQTVSKTLRNPVYGGLVRLSSWDVDVRGDFDPLVSEQVFRRVQALIHGNGAPKVHARESEHFPLRGFVRCHACDKPMTAAMSKGRGKYYGFYWCYRCRRVRVSKAGLEGLFVDLLSRLQPRPEFMRLFKAVVLDVWQNREVSLRGDRERREAELARLRAKLDRITDAFADGTLEKADYQRQRERLRQAIAVAEGALDETVTEHLDVDGILGFAETVLTDASRLWEHASADHKRRLQRVLFPEGVTYEPGPAGGIRTTATCLAFNRFGAPQDAESPMVALRGFEPRFDG